MSFSFGFSGDDIDTESDPPPSNAAQNVSSTTNPESTMPPPLPARTHDLDDLLATLPDKISWSMFETTSPRGHTARLPRRELFDVRLQLMAEDDGTTQNPLSGLDSTDLLPNTYEGGYKTWECSTDLVRFLLDRGPRKDLDDLVRVNHVVELGCGSALPSLLLFQYALRNALVGMYFSLTDYNGDVLRLVTVPNLVLAWAGAVGEGCFGGIGGKEGDGEGEFYITPDVLARFKSTLATLGITLTLLSGSWTPIPTLLSLIPSSPDLNTFILGSETIYSPASLTAFTEAISELMKRVKSGKAVVAAKRVYFGVGGSVDGFRGECAGRGCVAYEVEFEGLGDGGDGGVRRCLVEVQMY
ncbi:hypothetical protein CC80DRAFT_517481 [Byssothecium circinans]|uniref:protein-histidine N-methyltransferase n=1 Tax=Byssothecium circinans TaxID=147558 RepID=A0A6A5TRG2_9PLEO|nr:hypothetical protein CC80DRAFT_517481 [Byssothecium circinans]